MQTTPPAADKVSNVISYACPVTAGFLKELKEILKLVNFAMVFKLKLVIVIVPFAESALQK